MKNSEWLTEAAERLEKVGIETARLDALVLLCDVTGKSRAHLLAHPELELSNKQQSALRKLLTRRMEHEPLAYIRGKTEFYGREFYVNYNVLEPRPESETIISLLKNLLVDTPTSCAKDGPLRKKVLSEDQPRTVVDVGTGSGALAITAKLEWPEVEAVAIDVSPDCLEVARKNASQHSADITFLIGNLLEPITSNPLASPLIILANLPYVPDDYQINSAAKHEPRLAIFGGKDGLDLYRTMFDQLAEYDSGEIFVITESLPFQHPELLNIATTHSYTQIVEKDLIQVFKKY
jgi:release factor glutamine methyltransferase